jgi:hypothetical protein
VPRIRDGSRRRLRRRCTVIPKMDPRQRPLLTPLATREAANDAEIEARRHLAEYAGDEDETTGVSRHLPRLSLSTVKALITRVVRTIRGD